MLFFVTHFALVVANARFVFLMQKYDSSEAEYEWLYCAIK